MSSSLEQTKQGSLTLNKQEPSFGLSVRSKTPSAMTQVKSILMTDERRRDSQHSRGGRRGGERSVASGELQSASPQKIAPKPPNVVKFKKNQQRKSKSVAIKEKIKNLPPKTAGGIIQEQTDAILHLRSVRASLQELSSIQKLQYQLMKDAITQSYKKLDSKFSFGHDRKKCKKESRCCKGMNLMPGGRKTVNFDDEDKRIQDNYLKILKARMGDKKAYDALYDGDGLYFDCAPLYYNQMENVQHKAYFEDDGPEYEKLRYKKIDLSQSQNQTSNPNETVMSGEEDMIKHTIRQNKHINKKIKRKLNIPEEEISVTNEMLHGRSIEEEEKLSKDLIEEKLQEDVKRRMNVSEAQSSSKSDLFFYQPPEVRRQDLEDDSKLSKYQRNLLIRKRKEKRNLSQFWPLLYRKVLLRNNNKLDVNCFNAALEGGQRLDRKMENIRTAFTYGKRLDFDLLDKEYVEQKKYLNVIKKQFQPPAQIAQYGTQQQKNRQVNTEPVNILSNSQGLQKPSLQKPKIEKFEPFRASDLSKVSRGGTGSKTQTNDQVKSDQSSSNQNITEQTVNVLQLQNKKSSENAKQIGRRSSALRKPVSIKSPKNPKSPTKSDQNQNEKKQAEDKKQVIKQPSQRDSSGLQMTLSNDDLDIKSDTISTITEEQEMNSQIGTGVKSTRINNLNSKRLSDTYDDRTPHPLPTGRAHSLGHSSDDVNIGTARKTTDLNLLTARQTSQQSIKIIEASPPGRVPNEQSGEGVVKDTHTSTGLQYPDTIVENQNEESFLEQSKFLLQASGIPAEKQQKQISSSHRKPSNSRNQTLDPETNRRVKIQSILNISDQINEQNIDSSMKNQNNTGKHIQIRGRSRSREANGQQQQQLQQSNKGNGRNQQQQQHIKYKVMENQRQDDIGLVNLQIQTSRKTGMDINPGSPKQIETQPYNGDKRPKTAKVNKSPENKQLKIKQNFNLKISNSRYSKSLHPTKFLISPENKIQSAKHRNLKKIEFEDLPKDSVCEPQKSLTKPVVGSHRRILSPKNNCNKAIQCLVNRNNHINQISQEIENLQNSLNWSTPDYQGYTMSLKSPIRGQFIGSSEPAEDPSSNKNDDLLVFSSHSNLRYGEIIPEQYTAGSATDNNQFLVPHLSMSEQLKWKLLNEQIKTPRTKMSSLNSSHVNIRANFQTIFNNKTAQQRKKERILTAKIADNPNRIFEKHSTVPTWSAREQESKPYQTIQQPPVSGSFTGTQLNNAKNLQLNIQTQPNKIQFTQRSSINSQFLSAKSSTNSAVKLFNCYEDGNIRASLRHYNPQFLSKGSRRYQQSKNAK